MRDSRIRTLLFSTLYPSAAQPLHGIFVETRLRHLLATNAVDTKVVAPVPWFPSAHPGFGSWARMAAVPAFERRHDIEVSHPRYLLPPRIGMNLAPFALALGARRAIAKLIHDGFDFDLIDAHYYYPDGVAAAFLSRWFRKPFVITARGTDLNFIPRYAFPRRLIRWASLQAAASIGVCKALTEVLAEMGTPRERLFVFRNGVDLQTFRPLPRQQARSELDLPANARILLSVGHLVERKGVHVTVEAVDKLRAAGTDVLLAVVGDGEERGRLQEQVARLHLQSQVRFVGAVPQDQLCKWYSAADALVLASSREGWANVLLESMACGTPVVATRIWGTPEVVGASVAGELFEPRTADALARAALEVLNRKADPAAVRSYAEQFNWDATSLAQLELFRSVVQRAPDVGFAT